LSCFCLIAYSAFFAFIVVGVASFKVVDGVACIGCDFSSSIEFLACRCYVSFLHFTGCFALSEINYIVMEYSDDKRFAFLPIVHDELLVALCPGHLLEGLNLYSDESLVEKLS
jgi:hypothetical protein